MFKNIFKIVLLGFFFFQILSASSIVNDGFEELKKGNTLEALELFQNACEKGASSACYNLGLIYYKGEQIQQNYSKAVNLFFFFFENGRKN